MKRTISIGQQSFEEIRKNGYFYIDKTSFIKEWWDEADQVTLIARPRRFGKTLAMNMAENFFSIKYAGKEWLFEGLSIWEDEKYRRLQGTYPVIALSFADVKDESFIQARKAVCRIIETLYNQNDFLLKSPLLNQREKENFQKISANMENNEAYPSLKRLSEYLFRYYGKKVIILLDEYDTPMQEAYVNGYWEELAAFIRGLFNATFKTNPYLKRALLTGITRVSKESIFSDLNNLEVVTTTSEKYETAFGFTGEEVEKALAEFGLSESAGKVKYWYDGFRFGKKDGIYNPWSITKYLDSGKIGAYWANTSSNTLAGKLIREGTADIKISMEDLMEGKQIEASIDEEIIFNQLDQSDAAVWSLLLASGYLKVNGVVKEEEDEYDRADVGIGRYQCSLTNHEVRKMFQRMIQNWFGKSDVKYNDFIKALLANNISYMNRYMNQMAESVFSFFDTGNHPSERSEPERFYHGFVLGLIADSRINYTVTSNRESGFGRYDVMMEPKNPEDPAYVFEFKVHDPEMEATLQDTVKAALTQIREKDYDAVLLDRGIEKERIYHYGFAFEGKTVLIG